MKAGFLNFLRYMNSAYNPFIDRRRNHLVENMLKPSTCCANQGHVDYCQCLLITTVTALLIVILIYKGRAWMNCLKKGLLQKSCYPPPEQTSTKLANLQLSSEVIDHNFPEHKIGDFKRQISNTADTIDTDTSDEDVKKVFKAARIIDKCTSDDDEENVSNTAEIVDRDTSDEDEKQVSNTAKTIDRDTLDEDNKQVSNNKRTKDKYMSAEIQVTNFTESTNSAKRRTLTTLSSEPSQFEEKSTQTDFEDACRKCGSLSTLYAEPDKFCLNAIGDLDVKIPASTNEKLIHSLPSSIIQSKPPQKRRWNIEIEFNPNVLSS